MEPILMPATKAFVRFKDKILILRESSKYDEGTNGGKYDVPGGRIKPGEHFTNAITREVMEETGLKVRIGKPFFVSEWRPVIKGNQLQIVGIFFECFADSDEIKLCQDHDDYKWIDPKDYLKFNLIDTNKSAFTEYIETRSI